MGRDNERETNDGEYKADTKKTVIFWKVGVCNTLILKYIAFYDFWRFDLVQVILCSFFLLFDLKLLHETLN